MAGSWLTRVGPCAFGVLFLAAASAEEQQPIPAFPSRAEVITVDVAVLDEDGKPLRGLSRSDFTVLEEGAPQEIVAFEPRDLATITPEESVRAAAGLPPEEEGEGTPRRALAFIFDDLGLDARCGAAIEAMQTWVRESADPRDELTLVTTSGDVSFEGSIGSERGELLRSLQRLRCKRPGPAFFTPPGSDSPMTEWQAYQTTRQGGSQVAMMIVDWWRGRARTIVAAIETFSRVHGSEVGRKPVFVFAQGFIRDDDLKQAELAIDAAQRGNAALYFIDPRGLVAGDLVFPVNMMEVTHGIDLAGAEQMAIETGGATFRNNDTAGSLVRAIGESEAYYLLGYEPARTPDGTWRKLQVKVARKGVTVRARRGYYASAEPLADQVARSSGLPQQGQQRQPAAADQPNGRPAQQAREGGPQVEAPPAVAAAAPGVEAHSSRPQFSSLAEAITVDVVVLGKDGRPVRDLSPTDFTVLEDGRPQTIVGFEERALEPLESEEEAELEQETTDDRIATNEGGSQQAGRTIAFVIDDLGIEPLHMPAVADALSRWLAAGADPRDEVTIATSSGEALWSDTVHQGRGDLETVLRRVKGLKRLAGSQDPISDWESYAIDTMGSPVSEIDVRECVSTSAAPMTVLDRVVDLWFRTGACLCSDLNPAGSVRMCRYQVQGQARQVYSVARQRAVALLGVVERLSRGLRAGRGRKSIVILSGGLIRETERRAFETAVDASRRSNTSVSFVDVRGLIGQPLYNAERRAAPPAAHMGALSAEITLLETGGGDYLAETTGGSMLRNTNDIAAAVTRVADESSAYYLLGYQSDRRFDGRWRKLQVKVSRKGLKVRARRGYFATREEPPLTLAKESKNRKKDAKKTRGDLQRAKDQLPARVIDPALSVGGLRDEITLRVAPHVLEADASGSVRVLVVLEVDTAHLSFSDAGPERTTKLEVTILGVSRDQPKLVPLDSSVEVTLDSSRPGRWWIVSRELRLPPGVAQIRALVRDTASGRSGLVKQRFEIPNGAAAYLSTPILTDITAARGGLVAVAHRHFRPVGWLYCAYEVYLGPAGTELTVMPEVKAGYTLAYEDGRIVASAPPTLVGIALDARLTRLHAIPLEGLAPGRYQLRIEASDRKRGLWLEATESFVVAAPAGTD